MSIFKPRPLNDQEIVRRKKLEELIQQNNNPFQIEKILNLSCINEIIDIYKNKTTETIEEKKINCCGRVLLIRQTFFVISEEHNYIQAYINLKESSEELIEYFKKYLDIGDWVYVSGSIFFTKKQELTIRVQELKIISKCLKPLPEKHAGIKDKELLIRNRIGSTIVNKDIFDIFALRSKIIFEIRSFLNSLNYLEIETPMLQKVCSGAAARPFSTYYHALQENLYLRIAPELALKKAIMAGYKKIFEIGKSFRNEGIDSTHNPEFTSIEIYTAYQGLIETIELVEAIFHNIANVFNKSDVVWFNNNINLLNPYIKTSLSDLVKQKIGIDFYNNPPSLDQALKIIEKYSIELLPHEKTIGHILHKLFEELVEKTLIQPTFVYGYHKDVSPFSKTDPENLNFTLRFELFIGGKEFANGYAELNDPIEQLTRFETQLKEKKEGNNETSDIDWDYIQNMEYGLPPTGGIGIGIDRLVMLFCEKNSIKDVIFLPQLKK